jgi:phage gp46-like protein
MSAILTMLFAGLGRRFAYWGAIVAAVGVAVWLLIRQGRLAAEAELAIRRADARVRALQSSKDIRHEVQNTDRADLECRADRWMRD